MNVVSAINLAMTITLTVLFAYKAVLFFIGLFAKKKYPEAKEEHTFAVLIAGRDEEKVIGQLVESIKNQRYDHSKLKVFVVADNCTDGTADVVRKTAKGSDVEINVFERFNKVEVGKGYALDYLLSKIKETQSEYQPDAFFVFDADNLLDENYVHEMNKVLDSGNEIATSYRNSKNFNTNWVSATTAMLFLRECRFIHTPRAVIGSSTFISGTGFMVSSDVLNTDTGWKYTTLTEDIEFSTSSIIKGRKIAYCDDAIFYDEQPTTFKDSWNQRMRWQKGYYQVFSKYFWALFGSIFLRNAFSSYEMSLMIFPFAPISFFWGVFYYIFGFIDTVVTGGGIWLSPFLKGAILSVILLGVTYLLVALYGGLILFKERKRVKCSFGRGVWYSMMFPIFLVSFLPISIVCLFKRRVKWKKIPHVDNRGIEQMNEMKSEEK